MITGQSNILEYSNVPPPGDDRRWRRIKSVLFPVLTFLLVCGVLEAVVRAGWVQSFILPPPSEVASALFERNTDLWYGFLQTALAAVTGFCLSIVLGVMIAVVLSSSRIAQQALYPYAVFFQTVPIIAIAPMLVIWTDTKFQTVSIAACIASIFPIIANTYAGLTSTDPALRELFKLYGASSVSTLVKLRLPWALPSILTGLRVSAGLAIIGAMVGEFVGGGGLGSVIESARTQIRTDKVFAAVLLASLMGLALFTLVSLLSRLALRHWHPSEKDL
ncbi:MAG: ABC transporter permease [Burkholderiales bacterium]|nr:ABC transporter permease [Phycisphaerae bacterium]